MYKRLLWYIIFSIIIFFFFFSIILVNVIVENINTFKSIHSSLLTKIRRYKELNFYFCIVKTILFAITSILTIKERKLILKEIQQSPYLNIDENLTEALYKNIIEQGKHPDDNNLKEAYNRLINMSKENEDSKNYSQDAINQTYPSIKTNSEFHSKI